MEHVTQQPEYQADLMAEAAKLDAAVERAKHLEDKLKKREAKISDITNQLLVSREKNCKLEEQIASLVPLKLEVMARRSEVKSHKRTAEEQTHKSEELKAETTQLKLELAHAQKVAEGVHWEPLGATKRAHLEQERDELQESLDALHEEIRMLRAENAKLNESLAHFRHRERLQNQMRVKLERLAAGSKMACVEARDAGRREAAELLDTARNEAVKAEMAHTKTAKALEKAKIEVEKWKADAMQVRKAYPQSAAMDDAARAAKENAAFAEAAQKAAEKRAQEAIAKAEALDEALTIESAKSGAEKWRVECALHAKAKADEARAKALILLEAAEQAASRARDAAKDDVERVRAEYERKLARAQSGARKAIAPAPASAAAAAAPLAAIEQQAAPQPVRLVIRVSALQTAEAIDVSDSMRIMNERELAKAYVAQTATLESMQKDLESAQAKAEMAIEAEERLRAQLKKLQETTGANVNLLSKLDVDNDQLQSRVAYLEKILIISGIENDMSTAVAIRSLPDSVDPCKIRFETKGPRSLDETKLWLGFVRDDGTAAGFYRLGEWQEINSFIGAGILVLRLASWVRPDSERKDACKIDTHEVIFSFRPRHKDPHMVTIRLDPDGSVLAKAGLQGTNEQGWRKAVKLAPDPNIQRKLVAAYDVVNRRSDSPCFVGPDVSEAMSRLRLRIRDLPSESAMASWKIIDWSSKSLQDLDLVALAALGAHSCLDNVEVLRLDRNRIGNAGLISLSQACAAGSFSKVELLDLSDNAIGAEGIEAFAKACTSGGAFVRIQTLHLFGQKLDDRAMGHLCKALSLGGSHGSLMSCLVVLGLHNNAIGDDGIVALAHVILRGALATCRELYLHGNAIGERGMEDLADSLRQGALAMIQKLTLYNNLTSDSRVLAVLKKRAIDGEARKVALIGVEMEKAGQRARAM